MVFSTFRTQCLSNCDGLLRVSCLTPVNGFRCGLLVGLLDRLRVSFLTHVDGFRVGSLVGLLA